MVSGKWIQQRERIIHPLNGLLNITTSTIKHYQGVSANKQIKSGYLLKRVIIQQLFAHSKMHYS